MQEKPSDVIRPWFVAAEEVGEFIGIRFGHLSPDSTQPEWIFLRHADYDGIGGLAEILRGRGADVGRLMQIKHPAEPSWTAVLRSLPNYLKPRRRLKWIPMETGPAVSNAGNQPPPAVAWHVFDEYTTTQIRRLCRKAGVTVNSFLLKHLAKAIRPFLVDQAALIPWMIPVNLRGRLVRDRDTQNHSSYVCVKVKSFETVHDIHRNIYTSLGRAEHWANWQAYQSGRFITAGMKRFLVDTGLCMSQWTLGGFSNLGDWDAEKRITHRDCQGPWLFCPPVLRCQLIGAGCVTFQNRLSLTLQAHPHLTTSPAVPVAWVNGWVKEISMDLSSVLEEPVAMPVFAA